MLSEKILSSSFSDDPSAKAIYPKMPAVMYATAARAVPRKMNFFA